MTLSADWALKGTPSEETGWFEHVENYANISIGTFTRLVYRYLLSFDALLLGIRASHDVGSFFYNEQQKKCWFVT